MDDITSTNPLKNFLSNKRNVVIIASVLLLIVVYVIYLGLSKQQSASQSQSMITYENNAPTSGQQQYDAPTPTNSPEVAAAIEQQKQTDDEYANWQKTVREEYPWRKYLPFQTDKHYLMFDINKRIFVGQLYPTANDGVEQMKKDILAEMESKGIPTTKYPIEWHVNPE